MSFALSGMNGLSTLQDGFWGRWTSSIRQTTAARLTDFLRSNAASSQRCVYRSGGESLERVDINVHPVA